jgi:hypothetical protein
MPAKTFWPSLSVNSKKNCNPNKLPQFKKMSSLPWCIITIIHVGFLEYLSFKQFKLIVKMTRIESGVTIP